MTNSETLGVLWTSIIGIIVFLVCFFLFAWFKAKVPGIYHFRMLASQLSIYNDYNDEPVYAPEEPKGIFSWLPTTWLYTEDKLLQTHGLDAVMFTRFMKSCLWMCGILCPSAAMLLFPVYATGGRHYLRSSDPLYTSGLELISMSNLQQNDPRMWASIAFEYTVVFTVLVFLFFDYRAYYRYRIQYRTQERPTNYTLLLVDVPQSIDMLELVQERFNLLFPQDSPCVVPVFKFTCFEKLLDKLEHLQNRRERLEWKFSRADGHNEQERQCCRMSAKHIFGSPNRSLLEKLQSCKEMLRETKVQIAVERDKILKDMNSNTIAFFVIFRYKYQAAFARQTRLFEDTTHWVTYSAADPKGIHWRSFSWSRQSSFIRKSLCVAAILFLIIFWTIPVTFVSGLANIRRLSHVTALHWLSFIIKLSPTVVAFLDGILPAIILVLLFSLIPWLLGKILSQTRDFSLPHIDCQVQIWYIVFLVVQVFFVYTIGGSAFGNLQAMMNDPSNIPNLLSETIPTQGLFYMNYILIQGLVGFSISLLLIGRLFVRWFKLHWMANTEREKDRVITHAVKGFHYSTHYGAASIVLFLCLMYSVMSPLILFFGCIYFAFGLCVTKYQLMYVHVSVYEAGGIHFPNLFYFSITTLVLQQLVMTALFAIKQFRPGFILLILPFLTLYYTRWLLRQFGSVSEHGAVCTTISKDATVPMKYVDLYKYPYVWNSMEETSATSNI